MANNLPTVSSPLPRDLQQFVQRVREALDGGGVDGVLTARKLIATGIVTGTSTGNITASPSINSIIGIETPQPPTNLSASGAHASIIVSWNAPVYAGHAYTEIWAHTSDVIGDAVLVGMTSGNNFSHVIGGSGTRYYWVRNINQNGEAGAFNQTAGTQGATSVSPDFLMELLAVTYGTNSSSPFFQIDTETVINGVTIPAGTYMKNAFIHDASITNAKIKDLTADKITASLLNTVDFYGNKIAGTDIHLGGSVNYNVDSSGNNIGISSVSNPNISLFGNGSGALFNANVFSIRTTPTPATFTIKLIDWEKISVGAEIRFSKPNGDEISLEAEHKNNWGFYGYDAQDGVTYNVPPRPPFIGNTSTIFLNKELVKSNSDSSSFDTSDNLIFAQTLRGTSYSNTWQAYTDRHQLEFEVDGKIYTVACFGIISANDTFAGNSGSTLNKLPQHCPADNNSIYTNNSGVAGYPMNPYRAYGQTTGSTAQISGFPSENITTHNLGNPVGQSGSSYNSGDQLRRVYTPTALGGGPSDAGMTGALITVKVVDDSGSNVFAFDKGEQGQFDSNGNQYSTTQYDNKPLLHLIVGKVFTFNQNDSSNDGHPLVFEKNVSGPPEDGGTASNYEDGVKYFLDGSEVTRAQYINTTTFNAASDRKVELTVAVDAPDGGGNHYMYDPGRPNQTGYFGNYYATGYQDEILRYVCAVHGRGMGHYILTHRMYPYNAWANSDDGELNFRNTGLNLAAAINGIPGLSATYEELGRVTRSNYANQTYYFSDEHHIVRVIRDVTSSSGKTVVNREVTSSSLTLPTGLNASLIQSTNFNVATHYYRPEASHHNNATTSAAYPTITSGNSLTANNIEAAINQIDGFTATQNFSSGSSQYTGPYVVAVARDDMGNDNLAVTMSRVSYIDADGSTVNNTISINSSSTDFTVDDGALVNQMVAGQTQQVAEPFRVSNNTVFLTQAMIEDASIDNAKIGNVIQSSNYSAGTAGWKIDKTGQIEANDATFRGTLDVSNATTGDRLKITSTKIEVFDGSTLRVKIGDLS